MYTNNEDISLPMAVYLVHDSYDYIDDPMVISTTSLLKPIRQLVLSRQYRMNEKEGDVSSLVSSKLGTSIHDGIERAWLNETARNQALKDLGYPQKVIDRIVVNPTPEQLTEDCIPIYLEQRVIKEIGKYKISGKYDLIFNGRVIDIKSTGTYSYQKQTNADKYIQQGSIYRWLNQDKVTDDSMDIEYWFTDWSKLNSIKDPNYPKSRLLTQSFQLMSIPETEQFIKNKLSLLDQLKDAEQSEIPECTKEELWLDDPVFKYYKDPNKTSRSTKNFSTYHEANERLVKDGSVGIIKEIKGTPKACNYCSVAEVCEQRKSFVEQGLLNQL